MKPLLRIGLVLPVIALCACVRDIGPPGVFFSSDPPGARILIDGRDSGYVTPRMIALDEGERHRVELRMAGFDTHSMRLLPNKRVTWVVWDDGVATLYGLTFPLYLSFGDLVAPRRVNKLPAPGRIFVRLEPRGST